MTENIKTVTFVVAALLVLGLAIGLNRQPPSDIPHEDVNTPLFPDFKDPLAAKSLEIVKFDEGSGEVEQFKVAQVDGVWTIPSHQGYPADAEQQVASAATSIIGLKILGVESDEASLHEEYGVLEPSEENPGQKGTGTLVVMRDNDNDLARLLIGKAVAQAEDLRYVRRPGQNRVYRVEVDPAPLSTDFNDWIESDLLQMAGSQVKQLELKDYNVEVVQSGGGVSGVPRINSNVLLATAPTGGWELVRLVDYDENGKSTEVELGPEQQIATDKINALKAALDDLKIVDVARKPAGISQDLTVDDQLLNNLQAVSSLATRGFWPARLNDQLQIISNNGEIVAGTSEGVEYTLRFGDVAGVTEEKASEEDQKEPAADADEDGTSINRYLLVTAAFNKDLIPEPKLQPLPGAEDKGQSQAKPDETATKGTEGSPDAVTPAETDGETDRAEPADAGEAAEEEKTPDAPDAANDGEPANTEEQPEPAAEPSADDKREDQPEAATSQSTREAEAERKRIEAANKQAQKDYQEKIEAGQKRAAAINSRFAQWYYVIPESTYKRIHLTRDEIIVSKGPSGDDQQPAATIPGLNRNPLEGLGLPGGN